MKTINIPKLIKYLSEQIEIEEESIKRLPFENIKAEFTAVSKKNIKNYKKIISILKMVDAMIADRVANPKDPEKALANLDKHLDINQQ